MEKQLKEIIRSVIREEFISELSKNDIHVKEIMKFYDKGTYSTKKAVSIFVSGKPNATRNQILNDLGDMGYNDAWEVMDHFKLELEGVSEEAVPTGERIQNLNNRIKALRDKLSATKSPEQKKLFQDRLKNALQTLSNIKKDFGIKKESDVVPGGLAKGLTLNDIAEKHGVSVDIMVAEFKKGIAVEMEHTTDREVAKEITLDHLFEDPKYYDKLKKVEEYVDKKGVEHVAAALPQTEEEPVNEGKDCGCGCK